MGLRQRPKDSSTSPPPDPGLKSVIVPLDGSETAVRAMPLATQFAADLDIELVILNVITPSLADESLRTQRLIEELAEIPPQVERRVVKARFVARAVAEESADGIVCIATSAEPFDGDGFRHSVTDQLISSATSPVIVLGPNCDREPTISRIVVAMDPDQRQEGLAFWATRLGYQMDIPVEFVHVSESASLEPAVDATSGTPQPHSKIRIVQAAEGQSIAARLNEEAAGALLAMGSHGRTGFRRLVMGSVGAELIPSTTRPILILGPNTKRPI